MQKEIVFVFFLLVAVVSCDHHEGHNHGAHDHEEHGHGDHDHGDHDHGDHDHGDHSHGDHSHGDHSHEDHGNIARDCAEHLNAGQRESGVKRIKPQGCHHAIDVLCDMDTDGGGWTVIQKRGEYGNGPDYFYKTWNDYKHGFGEFDKELWIGNYHINHLTEQGNYELRIDMTTLSDEHLHVSYGTFRVDNATTNYAIHTEDFTGDSANSLLSANGIGFSTYDVDHDHNSESCATLAKGAWWYNDCGDASLNGPHMNDLNGDLTKSIYWFNSEGNPILLKAVKMMVRPKPKNTE